MNKYVGERLKKARTEKGLTQVQVYEYTKINNKTLSGYENGVSEPDLDTLGILAKLYGVSTDWLLGRSPFLKKELEKRGITRIDLDEEAEKRGLTPEEVVEILDTFETLMKKRRSK